MEAQSLFLPPQPAFLRRSQQVAPPRAPAVAFAGPEAALQEVEAAFAGPEDAEEKVKEADSRVLSEDGVLDGAKEGLIEFERFRKEGKAQVERQQPRGNVEHLERIMEVYRGLRKAEAEVEKAGVVPRDSEFAKIQQKRREVEVLSKKLRQAQAELKAALESLEALEKSHEESLKNLVISQQSQPLALISRLHRSVAYLDVDFCRCLQQAFQYITQSKPRLNQLYGDLAIAIDLFFAAEGYNARNNCRDTIMRSWEEISDIMEILEKHKNVLSRWNEEFIGSISATRLVKRRKGILYLIGQCNELLNKFSAFYVPRHAYSMFRQTLVYFNSTCILHDVPSTCHENPQRFYDILVGHSIFSSQNTFLIELEEVKRKCTLEELLLVHSREYIFNLQSRLSNIRTQVQFDQDTFVSSKSFDACLSASGAVCQAVDTIMQDSEIHNVFCIIRPPGHHAGVDGLVGKSVSQGFCLVNNIAIGARFALKQYSDTIKKVAIIDFDVHHGDGTENIVSGDNSIFFASLHAFDGEFYPGSGSFSFPSSGNVFNVPLELGYSSVEFLNALENSVIPSLRQFGPDMIFISAGFDARHGDAITEVRGSKGLSEDDYYRATLSITNLAWELCDGRVVSALEGGYGTDFLASCTVAHSCGMMDSSFMRKLSHNKSRILNQNMSK